MVLSKVNCWDTIFSTVDALSSGLWFVRFEENSTWYVFVPVVCPFKEWYYVIPDYPDSFPNLSNGCFRARIYKPLNTLYLRKQYGSKNWQREASTRFLTSDSLDRASSHSCVKGIGHWNPPNDACFWYKLGICHEHRLINKTKQDNSRVQDCKQHKQLCNGQGNHTKKTTFQHTYCNSTMFSTSKLLL